MFTITLFIYNIHILIFTKNHKNCLVFILYLWLYYLFSSALEIYTNHSYNLAYIYVPTLIILK
jgi:hypothetical protein